MKLCLMILALAVLSIGLVSAADFTADSDGVYLKLLGNSGKVMVGTEENVASDDERITIEMDSLTEVDSQGNAVGTSGTPKHSFNSFASQDFTFSELEDVTIQNVSAKAFTFKTTLKGLSSKLNVTFYFLRENGTLEFNGEKNEVSKGSVKWAIDVSEWEWCDATAKNCKKGNTDEVGAFLDLAIQIKGKGSVKAATSGDGTDAYDMGNGATLKLSKQVQYDDSTWKAMPTGYPKSEVQGSKQVFTFRFEKFTTSGHYDPTLALSVEGSDGTGGATAASISLATLLMVVMATFW